jgi:hypothetical protein
MKTSAIIKIAIALIFLFSGIAIADDWKNESGKRRPEYKHDGRDYKERSDHHGDDRDYKKRSDRHGHDDYKDYREHRGYKERPYDRGRHYGHYKYEGHQYDYHGHWRSWEQWDRYRRKYPEKYKRGHYYRENDHLMFRFCEPNGHCFFFSIGR